MGRANLKNFKLKMNNSSSRCPAPGLRRRRLPAAYILPAASRNEVRPRPGGLGETQAVTTSMITWLTRAGVAGSCRIRARVLSKSRHGDSARARALDHGPTWIIRDLPASDPTAGGRGRRPPGRTVTTGRFRILHAKFNFAYSVIQVLRF
jgi:hypothetical protein